MEKKIDIKKKEILSRITDLKVNIDAVTEINRSLVKEKREGMKIDFHEKNIKEKKKEIMAMISKEEEMLFLKEDRKK